MNRRRFLQFLTTAPIVAAVVKNVETPKVVEFIPTESEQTFVVSGERCWRDVIDITKANDSHEVYKLGSTLHRRWQP